MFPFKLKFGAILCPPALCPIVCTRLVCDSSWPRRPVILLLEPSVCRPLLKLLFDTPAEAGFSRVGVLVVVSALLVSVALFKLGELVF